MPGTIRRFSNISKHFQTARVKLRARNYTYAAEFTRLHSLVNYFDALITDHHCSVRDQMYKNFRPNWHILLRIFADSDPITELSPPCFIQAPLRCYNFQFRSLPLNAYVAFFVLIIESLVFFLFFRTWTWQRPPSAC